MTIENLKRRTRISDAQLDTEVIDCDLPILAGCFDDYNDYVSVLGLKVYEGADVRTTEYLQKSHRAAMEEVLRRWREFNPTVATYRALLNAVIRLPGKLKIAENICMFIAEKVVIK